MFSTDFDYDWNQILSLNQLHNTSIILNIEKNSITKFPKKEWMSINTFQLIHTDVKHFSQNISIADIAPKWFNDGFCVSVFMIRSVSKDEINSVDLDMMPGFRLTWKYSKQLEPHSKYLNTTYLPWMNYNSKNKQFIR